MAEATRHTKGSAQEQGRHKEGGECGSTTPRDIELHNMMLILGACDCGRIPVEALFKRRSLQG